MDLGSCNSLHGLSHHTTMESQPRNPYARIPSRRAIACVTCAKAKTKCDKALPSCSRCITKGIKCEPRSTRRTSELSQRSTIRKSSTALKKYQSTINCLGRSSSPQSLVTFNEIANPHMLSYDYDTTARTGQQALELSGIPTLSPLPSDPPHTFEKSYLYNHTPEYELVGHGHNIPESVLSSLGPLSPSTPEPIIFQEPMSAVQTAECNSWPQIWYGGVSTSTEHMIDPITSVNLPIGHWEAPNVAMTVPSYRFMNSPNVIFEQPYIPKTSISHHDACSFSGDQLSAENYSLDPTPNWMVGQPIHTELSTAASVPFLPEMQYGWEDVFIFGPSPCQNF